MTSELQPGLYDRIVLDAERAALDELGHRRLVAELRTVERAELADRVAELAAHWVRQYLAGTSEPERERTAVEIVTAINGLTRTTALPAAGNDDSPPPPLSEPIERLLAIERLAPTDEPLSIGRPLTPLRDTVLLTNARGEVSVGREIEGEITSADGIDLVLAFIRWTGIRILLPHLARRIEGGGRVRVITTTYTGSTELRALQALVDAGAEVKVSYDTSTTRLHAKAWLFHRSTGFSTVYIGSSNLTHSAQVTGVEWNVRASQRRNPELVEAFERTFETYWADPHYEPFDPDRFQAGTSGQGATVDDSIVTPFAITPYPFQRRMLERLTLERSRGHHRNLVVAATGTGKTVLAALDYQRLRGELPRDRLLFVAHRKEILQQSQAMFRHVLRKGSFGERWVDGERPQRWEHVFASIQSIAAGDAAAIEPGAFDVIVVDEFHHAAAESYRALLDHVQPRELIGLTATPERADGLSVLSWFDDRIAVELRLWDALEQGLLSPFHYFGVHDGTDLSAVTWRRGRGYDSAELTNVYTADDIWASKVISEVAAKVGDPGSMRALGFCVGIDHAEFMADRFKRAGIRAEAVISRTSGEARQRALAALDDGSVNVLFTVDLFNEGVDVPAIDVVLMLRPTESATVFLQQLGRGLRRAEGKDVLTVLDFVGHQATQFRFDLRFRQLLGRSRRELESDVADGFPFLPAGCQIELDPVARDIVLGNIRNALPSRWPEMVKELSRLGDVGLGVFLDESGLELDDLYRNRRTFTELRRAAGLAAGAGGPALLSADVAPTVAAKTVAAGVGRMIHVDDGERLGVYRRLLDRVSPPLMDGPGGLTELDRRRLEGLLLTVLNPGKGTFVSLTEAAEALWQHDELRAELVELFDVLTERVDRLHAPLEIGHPVPLHVHANYNREEILAAFGASTVARPMPLQTGVYWHEETRADLLFITLQKSERDYSPTTRYLDYAISDELFHWESQANTAADSTRGLDYIHHRARGRNVVLFIRQTKTVGCRTAPYLCAGPASYVEHRSELPMQITWHLHHRLPGDIFADYRAAVA